MRKVQHSSFEVKEYDDEVRIDVLPQSEPWHLSALLVWNALWLICGAVVFWQMLIAESRDMRLLLFTYLAFWFWFMYKAVYFFLWKRYGKERIAITANTLAYKKEILTYGRVQEYDLVNVKQLKPFEVDKKSFGWSYQQSFWMPGTPAVSFSYFGKEIGLGLGMPSEHHKQFIRQLKSAMQQLGKNA